MKQILVTGGCGYIGSHTIVDLLQHGFEVISVDDNSKSEPQILNGVEKITGTKVKNYKVNLCNFEETYAIFAENEGIDGIIHFAAYKAVGESVAAPLDYYSNNLNSLINVLRCASTFKIPHFVFSSSCTVYGNPAVIPVNELTAQQPATSPYGATKQMGEEIVQHSIQANGQMSAILLRYFNPVGAHPSNHIGEVPLGTPQNLVPAITQTAIGKLPQLKVWGSDYDSKDGTCIRDYIHVCDIAHAHTLAIKKLYSSNTTNHCEIYNLGSGNGYTVLELISTFEKVSGQKLNYTLAERRQGDVVAIYADIKKAINELKWMPKYSAEDMMHTAWEWEKKLKIESNLLTTQQADLN